MVSQSTSLLEPTLHNTSKGIENSLGCKVFGGDEVDEMLLPSFLLQVPISIRANFHFLGVAYILENLVDSGVGMFEICREEL